MSFYVGWQSRSDLFRFRRTAQILTVNLTLGTERLRWPLIAAAARGARVLARFTYRLPSVAAVSVDHLRGIKRMGWRRYSLGRTAFVVARVSTTSDAHCGLGAFSLDPPIGVRWG
jgi:hypothetical protein